MIAHQRSSRSSQKRSYEQKACTNQEDVVQEAIEPSHMEQEQAAWMRQREAARALENEASDSSNEN